jgi:hypothetical protein
VKSAVGVDHKFERPTFALLASVGVDTLEIKATKIRFGRLARLPDEGQYRRSRGLEVALMVAAISANRVPDRPGPSLALRLETRLSKLSVKTPAKSGTPARSLASA